MRGTWLVSVLAAACGGPAPSRPPAPAATVSAARPMPTRSYAECRSERIKMLADSAVTGVVPPQPTGIVIPPSRPPYEIPRDVRGHRITVHFLVDEHGQVARDSIDAPVSRDTAWVGEFQRRLHRYQFLPAVLNGCAVPDWFTIRLTL